MSSGRPACAPVGARDYSAAQRRTIDAALDLFAQHGVHGTSLQMIADATGVTKAAVYHQFHTKEAIVIAAVEAELSKLEGALRGAEAGGPGSVRTLLEQVIDLAVGQRRMVSTTLHDPVVTRLLAEHQPFRDYMSRLFRTLLGPEPDPSTRIRVAMVMSAIGGVVTHPLIAGLDVAEVRRDLLDLSLEFLEG